MANTTRIKDLSAVTSVADTDVLPVDGANGTKGVTFGNLSTAALNKLMSKTYGLRVSCADTSLPAWHHAGYCR